MPTLALKRASERRAEYLLTDLLVSQGWDLRRPPQGDVVFQHEYRSFPELQEALATASKTGVGPGVPEAILLDRETNAPLAIIETKGRAGDIETAITEAQGYGNALHQQGHPVLAIGLAGTSEDEFALRVTKLVGAGWQAITYDEHLISWIPTRVDLDRIVVPKGPTEIRPSIPPLDVLATRADEINRLLREARIKDEFRPVVVAAVMLALWHSRGEIRRDSRYILRDINASCRDAFIRAGRTDLARSLRVDEANQKLREKTKRIATILERLNVTVLTTEHDYLGHLYETFFRYTGGNTIGQYFTPRHITRMMADVCEVTKDDVVLDPACGTGGFLIACMDRIARVHHISREQMVSIVQEHLIGFEDEPVTAALCIANMILRGDGSTGVHRDDAFRSPKYPQETATVALMNPPFPHKKTDTPIEKFVERALEGLKDRGKFAVILKASLLAKRDKGAWRSSVLKNNTLLAVCQLPDELFQPFASTNTAFAVLEKGVPHHPHRKTMFVRLHHDGLTLKKGARVERDSEPNQVSDGIDAILNHTARPGFSGAAAIGDDDEWTPGAYIESAPACKTELRDNVDVLLRRLASFYTRYAKEVVEQRRMIEAGDLEVRPYRELVSKARRKNAKEIPSNAGTIGGMFDIFYGMKALHSREGFAPGPSLVISPTEEYNGCYGWLDFPTLLRPPFVTVAQTGSIGEAFLQCEPCAVNDDCLILLPKTDATVRMSDLVLAAACLQGEKWRFTYGRKLTPSRIADFEMPAVEETFVMWLDEKLHATGEVGSASLAPYQTEDERDAEISQRRLDEIESFPQRVVRGEALSEQLRSIV
jgi:predicted RNA methylase